MPVIEFNSGVQLVPLGQQCHAAFTVVCQYDRQNSCINLNQSNAHKEFANLVLAGSKVTNVIFRDEHYPGTSPFPGIAVVESARYWTITYEN